MRSGRGPSLLIFGMFVVLMGGCAIEVSDPPTVQSWQQGLEKYVWDRGNGDPNVLADLSWDDVHHGFAVIGDPLPDRSTDQIGLLVAHRTFEGKPYFVFLLATVRNQELDSLRAVALQVEGKAFHWAVGEDDPKSLSAYRAWSDAGRAPPSDARVAPPPFPGRDGTFLVTVEQDQFVIVHRESGARWNVRPTSDGAAPALTGSRPEKS